ncbi:late control protein [Fusobacterium necrophorum]|uniref:phage late control D family protein n=1 Tax=Fusobacterium necrophorum TaxID=859 RepID=UPI00254E1F64|nr:late control protein [Fusobacterium necrophorum]MDK4472350.1 late control protein [Fusobacterium necrophorum]MDK4478396.1 late control protein [Fusobacterium necrophorum]MDK4518734.1 late control protein [Fusobacterium necrophorum]
MDELVIKLDNEKNKFLSSNWVIPKKTQISFGIKTINWESELEGEKYHQIGVYNIDNRQFSRKDATFKAISGPLHAKDNKHSKTWAKVSLEALGKEFADRYKLKYFYKVKEEITLQNLKQEEQPDFEFLNKVAQDEGVKLKITNGILVLFEEEIFINGKSLLTVSLDHVSDFQIKDKTNDIYDAIEVKYFNTKKQKEEKAVITKSEIETGKKDEEPKKIYVLKSKPKGGDLKKLAKKILENINKREIEISLKIIGCKELFTGCVIEILDAGEFSGKYIVTQIQHKFPKFETSIEAYKVKRSEVK